MLTRSKEDGGIVLYNPLTKNKWLSLEWEDGVLAIFNYITGNYIFGYVYKQQNKEQK